MKAIVPFILTSCLLATDSARGDVSVSLIRATASTIGFAPLDQSQYYDVNTLVDTSPALVSVNHDWSGTNYNGTANTWRMIGAANVNATTNHSRNQLSIVAHGAFSYDMTTTSSFVSPNSMSLLYAPGAGANYACTFAIDSPSEYSMSGLLANFSRMTIYSVTQNRTIFRQDNDFDTPLQVNTGGMLPAGQYTVGATTGLSGATNMGISHWVYSGSFTNFNFTVSVPEPALLGALGFAGLFLRRRR